MENMTSLEDPVYFKLRRNIEFCEVRILCFRPDVTNFYLFYLFIKRMHP